MSIESFIHAMPKAEIHIRLEGAVPKQTLLMLADQNEVRDTLKHFNSWVDLLNRPQYTRLDELIQVTMEWVRYPEDLARIVYDAGVALHKQNIRYAELMIDPTIFVDAGMGFEQFMEALVDGANRARRGWGIRMAWILAIPRTKPRRGDDVARWVSSASGRKASIVGLGLCGADDSQPVGQFKRAFTTAEKKMVDRVVVGGASGPEAILSALQELSPNRILNPADAIQTPEFMALVRQQQITLGISLTAEERAGRIKNASEYALRQLYDDDIQVVLGSDMPVLYGKNLNDTYLAVHQAGLLSLDELLQVSLNAVRYSFLPSDEKEKLLAEFTEAYEELGKEHLASQDA